MQHFTGDSLKDFQVILRLKQVLSVYGLQMHTNLEHTPWHIDLVRKFYNELKPVYDIMVDEFKKRVLNSIPPDDNTPLIFSLTAEDVIERDDIKTIRLQDVDLTCFKQSSISTEEIERAHIILFMSLDEDELQSSTKSLLNQERSVLQASTNTALLKHEINVWPFLYSENVGINFINVLKSRY